MRSTTERPRERAIDVVGDEVVVTWTSPHLLELSAAGVTKASTLARVCEHVGVGAGEVLAFGDMPNDTAMLSWAGRGYAVAGADPLAVAAADEVVPSNDDDGVARTLARVFDLDRRWPGPDLRVEGERS